MKVAPFSVFVLIGGTVGILLEGLVFIEEINRILDMDIAEEKTHFVSFFILKIYNK